MKEKNFNTIFHLSIQSRPLCVGSCPKVMALDILAGQKQIWFVCPLCPPCPLYPLCPLCHADFSQKIPPPQQQEVWITHSCLQKALDHRPIWHLTDQGGQLGLLNLICGIFTLKAHTMHWNAAEGKCLQLRGSIRSKEANLFPHRE